MMGATAHQSGLSAQTRLQRHAGAAISSVRPDLVLTAAAARLQALTDANGVAIALDTNGLIVCRASVGAAPEVGTELLGGTGLSAACIRTGAIVCSADTTRDNRADAATCRALNVRSAVIAPVTAEGTAIGIVACFWSRPRAFDTEAVSAATYLADWIAPSVQCDTTAPGFSAHRPRSQRTVRVIGWAACVLVVAGAAAIYNWQRSQRSEPRWSFRGGAAAGQTDSRPRVHATVPMMAERSLQANVTADPVLLSRVEPEYPKNAVARATEREIVLDVIINNDGRVAQVKIVRGDPILALTAAGAVSQWRYQPAGHSDPMSRAMTRIVLRAP